MPRDLTALAVSFLRLGATAFGGPVAHVALMEDEVVRRRAWLSREEFLDLYAASQLIPGPNSTELAIHIGHRRAGWRGLLVAGACFILPAMALVWLAAWSYVRYGARPDVAAALAGVKPVVLAIVLQALARFAGTSLTSAMTCAIAGLALVATAIGVHEFVVLAGAGALAWLDWQVTRGGNPWERGTPGLGMIVPLAGRGATATPLTSVGGTGGAATTVAGGLVLAGGAAPGLASLFLVMLKAGSLLFGSGYVLLAFLHTDVVVRTGWLTEGQLADAVAIGQFTPGPLFTTATFVGYLVAGHAGAAVATAGIFLPAFAFVALTAPLVARMRASPAARATLGGLNAASLALMAAVTLPLARDALAPPVLGTALAIAALAMLRWTRVNPGWLVAGGGLVGALVR